MIKQITVIAAFLTMPLFAMRSAQREPLALEPAKLVNVGNSCFMNAALQCLYSLEELTNLLFTKYELFKKESSAQSYVDLINFIKGMPGDELEPRIMCEHGWRMLARDNFSQQDADEFLTELLERIGDSDIKEESKREFIRYAGSTTVASDLSQLYYFQLNSLLTDAKTQWQSEPKTDPAAVLNVPIHQEDKSLQECLQRFFDGETIDDYRLPSDMLVSVQRKFSLKEAGKYFIISLKRNSGGIRNESTISFPYYDLNLNAFADKPLEKSNYHLKAVIMHGGNVNGGHYTAYVNYDSQWYYCNDSSVTPVDDIEMRAIASRGFGTYESVIPTTLFYEQDAPRPLIVWPDGNWFEQQWINKIK